MDLLNSTLLPFVIMIALSIALVYCVRLVRSRVKSKRDNRFIVSVISLNIIFLVLNLPIATIALTGDDSIQNQLVLYFFQYLVYLYYAIGFYVQLVVNSDFKNEFLKLVNLKSTNPSAETTEVGSVSKRLDNLEKNRGKI